MIKELRTTYRNWRLRRVQVKHAQWKAKHEEWLRQLQMDRNFASNPYNRHATIRAAGQEAKYAEQVELLLRS